jgi:hypothetical protein
LAPHRLFFDVGTIYKYRYLIYREQTVATDNLQNNYKVRLIAVSSLLFGTSSSSASQVTFEVTPTFSESGDVGYDAIQPIHMPGGMQVYKQTSSRRFSIGATFISRTSQEATQNLMYLQALRGWRMPYFGNSSTLTDDQKKLTRTNITTNQITNAATPLTPEQRAKAAVKRGKEEGIELLGAPPDVLYLYAYSTGDNNSRQVNYGVNINRVPVVLTGLEISYPNDVDYLPTFSNTSTGLYGVSYDNTSEPFPMKMDVSVTLAETHSPREYESFSLALFKQGRLTGF